jgi:hypothetical protein
MATSSNKASKQKKHKKEKVEDREQLDGSFVVTRAFTLQVIFLKQ